MVASYYDRPTRRPPRGHQFKYEITPLTSSGAPAGTLRSATQLRLSSATTLSKSAPTRLRKAWSSTTDPSAQADGFFIFKAVYLTWSLRDTPGGEYMRQALEHGLPAGGFVSLTERKSIVGWLRRSIRSRQVVPLSVNHATGLTATVRILPSLRTVGFDCTCADVDTIVGLLSWRQAATSSPSKRRYVLDAVEVEVGKKIRQDDAELRDHNAMLRGIKNNKTSLVPVQVLCLL
ncbi:hypothetical protein EI94DRAFT_1813621 [Lactarius quietus]|nr:hypothetical protein EI94DRAFT_1813621 [Lactarius quietus]